MANTTVNGTSDSLARYVAARSAESGLIPAERQARLTELARHVHDAVDDGGARLTFICTHNSRRSQMAQVWARIAAEHHGIELVESYSGGTEATAFNPRAVAALTRAGILLEASEESDNPVYRVSWSGQDEPLECWSKRFEDEANPRESFIAVMTCSDADGACPFVPGAAQRVSLTYDDPKSFDGTAREIRAYDERCEQIAREMLFVFLAAAEG